MASSMLLAPLQWSAESLACADWHGATESSVYRVWSHIESVYQYVVASAPSVSWMVANHYVDAEPLESALVMVVLAALYCWLASLATGNCSQVDRLWSIVPVVYVWHFAAHDWLKALVHQVAASSAVTPPSLSSIVALASDTDFAVRHFDGRLVAMAVLSSVWGVRLTYNFARKGGYSAGSEDYRWPVLRDSMHPLLFQVFNVSFIATYQNLLLFLFASPAYIAWRATAITSWNVLDSIATLAFAVFLIGESIADQQQWAFQQAKRIGTSANAATRCGFITSGLFRYSRHPNFFCEMSLWWSFYLFSVAASGVWFNWSMVGTALLTLLFQGSTRFTEKLSLKKYPLYARYQATTSRLIPFLPGAPIVTTDKPSTKKHN
jgi:steroid 5-alpha reductase family enzyme